MTCSRKTLQAGIDVAAFPPRGVVRRLPRGRVSRVVCRLSRGGTVSTCVALLQVQA